MRNMLRIFLVIAFLVTLTAVQPAASAQEIEPTEDPYFVVPPTIATLSDDPTVWNLELKPHDGINEYTLRVIQDENVYSTTVLPNESLDVAITGSQIEDAELDFSIGADLELLHTIDGSETVIARYEDLYPLPLPEKFAGEGFTDPVNIHPTYPSLPTDENNQALRNPDRSFVGAADVNDFRGDGQCAVLDPSLPILTPPVSLSGWIAGSQKSQYVGYVWHAKEDYNAFRVTGDITPIPWATDVEAWHFQPLSMQLLVSAGLTRHWTWAPSTTYPEGHRPGFYDNTSAQFDNSPNLVTESGGIIASETADGWYVPIGVRSAIRAQHSFDLTVTQERIPPLTNLPEPVSPTPEPCQVFQNMRVEPGSELDDIQAFLEITIAASEISTEFAPGADCVDAAVNGVDALNAIGCAADLVSAGVPLGKLRSASRVGAGFKQDGRVVAAVEGIDAEQFATDILRLQEQ